MILSRLTQCTDRKCFFMFKHHVFAQTYEYLKL